MKSLLEKGFVTVRRYHKGTSNFKEYSLVNFSNLTILEILRFQSVYHCPGFKCCSNLHQFIFHNNQDNLNGLKSLGNFL